MIEWSRATFVACSNHHPVRDNCCSYRNLTCPGMTRLHFRQGIGCKRFSSRELPLILLRLLEIEIGGKVDADTAVGCS